MGVIEPYDKVIFAFSIVLILQITLLLLRSVRGFKMDKGGNYRFNSPDFTELQGLNSAIKKINVELDDIRKSIGLKPNVVG